ncbi:hypothetical protein ASE91_08520 [Sphingomonas sp. Leaf62]|nr:hypothetical protein ASE91_08520 [Sphingomonas sp. Leaf62]
MSAVAWLPADTQPPAALDALFAGAVAAWEAQWFVGGAGQAPRLRRGGGAGWRRNAAGLAIGTAPDTALRIGARIVGVSADGRHGADRAVLEGVAEPCLLDLRTRLVAVTGGDDGFVPVPASDRMAMLGDGLAFGLSDALFAVLVRRVLPPVVLPRPGSGAQALAAIPVEVGAAVGRAAMRLADLRALEVGDVVVLDRALADPVPIALNGRPLPRGRVRVVPAEPIPSLQIVDVAA